jgi:hypothetical protein
MNALRSRRTPSCLQSLTLLGSLWLAGCCTGPLAFSPQFTDHAPESCCHTTIHDLSIVSATLARRP